MSGPDYDSRDIVIRPVTPDEIAAVRRWCGRFPDGTDLLEALGIGGVIDILTTDQTQVQP